MKHQPLNAEAVKDLAAAKGIDNQTQLAQLAKLDRSLLSKILRGVSPAQPSHVHALAEALEVEPADLLVEKVSA